MRLGDFDVEVRVLGPFQENAYRITHVPSGRAAVVDPGMAPDEVIARLARGVDCILLTHGHLDHIAGLPAAKAASGAPVVAGRGEAEFLRDPELNGSARWPELFGAPLVLDPPDREVADGEELELGGGRLRVWHVPGHTPHHVVDALLDGAGNPVGVIAGDTLFAGSIGRTDLPGGDMATLLRSIREKLLSLPDDVVVCPGHGPWTTVGRERFGNPFVGSRARFPV